MSSIFPFIFLACLLALSSASTPNPTSLSGASNSPASSHLNQTIQKSSSFCYSNNDCWSSALGTYSTCVSNYCTCDFGYKKDLSTGKCNQIACTYTTDCSMYFTNSKCGYSGSCVCETNYVQNSTTAKCAKKGCTWSFDCPGTMTTCRNNKCVCWSDDYERDSNGDCQYTYPYTRSAVSAILGVFGTIAIITIVVVVIVLICRKRRTAGRVIQLPGGPQQPVYAVPAGYQAGYQTAPPMYPSPYGNFQGQPQPTVAVQTQTKG